MTKVRTSSRQTRKLDNMRSQKLCSPDEQGEMGNLMNTTFDGQLHGHQHSDFRVASNICYC